MWQNLYSGSSVAMPSFTHFEGIFPALVSEGSKTLTSRAAVNVCQAKQVNQKQKVLAQ
jgi:hypothetical protein